MGLIGGGVFHLFKGMRNSPRGERMRGGFNAVTLRAPTLGGAFAVWGGLFATFDCTYAHLRKREDPWNAIMSGATTGGVLAARAGWKAMGKNAFIGGMLLGVMEGLGIMAEKMLRPEAPSTQVMAPPTRVDSEPEKVDLDDYITDAAAVADDEFEFSDVGNMFSDDILDDFTLDIGGEDFERRE